MNIKNPIYPSVVIRGDGRTLIFETILRKEWKGKYYLWRFANMLYLSEETSEIEKLEALSRFNKDVYLAITIGKVNESLEFMLNDGSMEKVFQLDSDQRSEEERLSTQLK